jgi:hypothetical protein
MIFPRSALREKNKKNTPILCIMALLKVKSVLCLLTIPSCFMSSFEVVHGQNLGGGMSCTAETDFVPYMAFYVRYSLSCSSDLCTLYAELFGRASPQTSPSLKISDFENPSDSDSACLFVYAFIL